MRRLIAVVAAIAVGASLIGAVTASSATRVNVTEREYKVKPSRTKAPAGKVKFVVTNKGDLVHELEVVKWSRDRGDPGEAEQGELRRGPRDGRGRGHRARRDQALHRESQARRYVLLCNVVGHYELGQYRGFRVTK